jgi:hypothetical protein
MGEFDRSGTHHVRQPYGCGLDSAEENVGQDMLALDGEPSCDFEVFAEAVLAELAQMLLKALPRLFPCEPWRKQFENIAKIGEDVLDGLAPLGEIIDEGVKGDLSCRFSTKLHIEAVITPLGVLDPTTAPGSTVLGGVFQL